MKKGDGAASESIGRDDVSTRENAVNDPADEPASDGLPQYEALTPELVEDEAIRGDFMLRWAVVLLAFLFGFTAVSQTETLVHVKTGQYLADHGFLPPKTDVFSSTAVDRDWVNLSWLFDLFAAGVYSLGGWVSVTVVKALLAGVVFWLLVNARRREVSTWWGTIAATLVLLVCYPQFTMRPEVVTLLGVGLTMWFLIRREEDADSKAIWALVPIFAVWANLDPRMFLGLALLVLYAAGESIDAVMGRRATTLEPRPAQIWAVTGASAVFSLLNPFFWKAPAAAISLYGVDYPALRLYNRVPESIVRLQDYSMIDVLQYYPMYEPDFWRFPMHHTIAGLLLAVTALFLLVLNLRRAPASHFLAFLGFAGFAAVATHELAAASIVFGAIAAVNAQDWYRNNFPQEYSTRTSELAFSRGGRAVTVVALFVLAYLNGSGRLGEYNGRRTGVGLGKEIQTPVNALRTELKDSLDDRPFNFLLTQGDMLIWIDEKPFVDSRVRLFAGSGDEDLLQTHYEVRGALRDPAGVEWKDPFDQYQITHVVPRLAGDNPDFETYTALLISPDWQLTRFGAATAVFYRTDAPSTDLKNYLASHRMNFVELAFRKRQEEPIARIDWPRGRSSYENFLSLPRYEKPASVQLAGHYRRHLEMAMGREILIPDGLTAAMAHLAIRNANAGLAQDPNNGDAFQDLGVAYRFLEILEAAKTGQPSIGSVSERRFYQAVQSLRQAAIVKPDSPTVHQLLAQLYHSHGRWDLALAEFDAYERLNEPDKPAGSEEDEEDGSQAARDQNAQFREKLMERIESVRTQANEALEKSPESRLQIAAQVFNQGCVLMGRQILQDDPSLSDQDPRPLLLGGRFMLETGNARGADDVFRRVEQMVGDDRRLQWRDLAAFAALGKADYARAVQLWSGELKQKEDARVESLLDTMPLSANPPLPPQMAFATEWPLLHVTAAMASLYSMPLSTAQTEMNIALCHTEAGRHEEAAAMLRRLIDEAPNSPLRPLAGFYLYLITDEPMPDHPADVIPIPPASDRPDDSDVPADSDVFAAGSPEKTTQP